jgi:hypothetical protein
MQMKNIDKEETKQSFIAEARRAQIIEAAIRTLDEIGYVQASLAQIAKRAGISTALISYHFSDKDDLMNLGKINGVCFREDASAEHASGEVGYVYCRKLSLSSYTPCP